MKIRLSNQETQRLHSAGIAFDLQKEYDDDSAFSLLDEVRSQEIYYAQKSGFCSKAEANIWAKLADKIQTQIPED